jgi:hypothetical protein
MEVNTVNLFVKTRCCYGEEEENSKVTHYVENESEKKKHSS